MRSRNLKPGFFDNEVLARCEPLARLLFAGLWCVADCDGRVEDRPDRIKVKVLPYDNCETDALLTLLHNRGFIYRYEVDGIGVIQIAKFTEHQRPHPNEACADLPAPDKEAVKLHEMKCKEMSKCALPSSNLNPSSLIPSCGSELGSEPTSDGKPSSASRNPKTTAETDASPVFLAFPVSGRGVKKEWLLRQSLVSELAEAYPGVDVPAASRKALQWVRANPKRAKTARGMPAFLNAWMGRDQDKGGGSKPDLFTGAREFLADG